MKEYISKTVSKDIPDFDHNYYIHCITIDDFETLIGIKNVNIHDYLYEKRNNEKYSRYDFGDYYAEKFSGTSQNDYLNNIMKDFFDKIKESFTN